MTSHDPGRTSQPHRAAPGPRTLGPDEIDLNLYRTELHSDRSDGGPGWWTLRIDNVVIAHSGTAMDQEQAITWAQQVMGEGVAFLNGLAVEPSCYWVANPQMPVRPIQTRPPDRRT